MILEKGVVTFPPELLEEANALAKAAGFSMLSSYLAMSPENAYVREDDGRPLLLVGAFRPSFLSSYKEVWLVASIHFRAWHVKESRKLLWEWLREQDLDIFVRCAQPQAARFAEIMGFKLRERDATTSIYGVS